MSAAKVVTAIVLGVVLVGSIVEATVLYYNHREWRETLEFGAALVGGAGVIFGAVYAFLVAAESSDDTRRKRSLELIDQLNDLELVRLRASLERRLTEHTSGSPWSEETKTDAFFLLGLLEDLALAIRSRIADEQVLYESMSFVVPRIIGISNSLIRATRDETNDPTVYVEILGLAEQWKKGRSYRTGRKLKKLSIAPPESPHG